MRTLFILTLFLSSFTLRADAQVVEDCETSADSKLMQALKKTSEVPTCPNAKKIKNICLFVSDRTRDKEPISSNYQFVYQRKLFEAACVDIGKDDEKVMAQKIQHAWSTFEKELVCNSPQFDVINGNIIKYAVTKNFDTFIDDITIWRINLNKIDESDKMTALDYIRSKIASAQNSDLKRMLQGYYDKLRKAGAKHRTEL